MTAEEEEKATAAATTKPLHVVFLHLDLGVGGAEQLVLQLATASRSLHHRVDLVTTRCDPDHCFSAVQPGGNLHSSLHVYGRWIPSNIFGKATALCSTIRVLWLALVICFKKQHNEADVIVIDVLPTPIPLLRYFLEATTRILFYCHFPDKLLLRGGGSSSSSSGGSGGFLKQTYRSIMDTLEEQTMIQADVLVVNSKFTQQTVQRTFPSLMTSHRQQQMGVLYPALDTKHIIPSDEEVSSPSLIRGTTEKTRQSPIVSLNRFERKKNIGLLLEAYAKLCAKVKLLSNDGLEDDNDDSLLPQLIIAGGYDVKNVENVEYRGELEQQLRQFQRDGIIPKDKVLFQTDISDQDRSRLFQTALCVVYTPDQEHFGIVPLEAMASATPVIAVASGGPLETIVDAKTGYLCDNRPDAFMDALFKLWSDPKLATSMGQAGQKHVLETFGPERLQREWEHWIKVTTHSERAPPGVMSRFLSYMLELNVALIFTIVLTFLLRMIGVLSAEQSIWGKIRESFVGDEL